MAKNPIQTIQEEAGLDSSWKPVDSAPIVPSNPSSWPSPNTPPLPNAMANNFGGVLNPAGQHDVFFVHTQVGSPSIPKLPLLPLAASGQPTVGAAVQSGSSVTIVDTASSVAAGPAGAIQFNNSGPLGGSGALTWNNVGNILTISGGAVVNGSVTITGSIIISGTVAANIFNATTGFEIGGTATSGQYLRGNGTNFVSAVLSGSDIATGIVGIPFGGTGTATPALVQGQDITITGSWPDNTIAVKTQVGVTPGSYTNTNLTVDSSGIITAVSNGSSGGSGTVNPGTANQVAYYAATGSAISGDTRLTDNATALAYSGSGGIVGNNGLTAGVAGTTSGVLTLNGSSSGSCSITAPAVAGTITNAITVSNSVQLTSGTVLSINGDVGISRNSAGNMFFGNGTNGSTACNVFASSYQIGGNAATYGSKISVYNSGIGTLGSGVPYIVAQSKLTGRTAAITATTIYAVPNNATTGTGMYRLNYVATITTADSTSSTLGGTNGFQVIFTDNNDSVVKTSNPTTPVVSSVNATSTTISGSLIAYCKPNTNLQYAFGYTAGTGNMAYDLTIYVEHMN